jgi:hypothetical protein
MNLLKHQEELLASLNSASKRHLSNEVIYKSEWLGYLPFGQYHWVEINGEEIQPSNYDSLQEDLSLLAQLGALKIIKEVQLNAEDNHIYYQLIEK